MGIKLMFVPKYELAVFRGHPSPDPAEPARPCFPFPRDKSGALGEAYHKVAEALTEGGYWGDPVRSLFDENQLEWLG